MTRHLNWYKRSPRDWQTGTTGMSLELRGFYSAFLDAQWEHQGQLPKDDKWMAMSCQCSTRMVRALLPKLISFGKIIETESGYYNRRMMADILGLEDVKPNGEFTSVSRSSQPPVERHSQPSRARVEHESSTKNPKNSAITTRVLESETEAERSTPIPPKGGVTNFWGSALNPKMHGDDSGVVFEKGAIALVNGNRKFWSEQFDGDDGALDLALIEVSGRVRPNSGRPLKTQVDAILAGIARDRRDRTARYREAADRNRPAVRSQPNALDVLQKMSFS